MELNKNFNLSKSFFKNIFTSYITYILIFCFILFVIGINWGLPNKHTWQSDSLAPKTPIYAGFTGFLPGYFYKYPIVHQILLFIFNLPVLVFIFFTDHIFHADKILSLTQFCTLIFENRMYLTILTYIDRFISVIMGVLIVYFIYLSAKELFNEEAGLFAALITAFNPILNHYSHVAKVEVPYIFWAVLAIYTLIRVIKYENKKDYILSAIFICLSFGSKDQGYAIFILPIILYLIIFQLLNKEKNTKIINILFRKNILIFISYFIICTIIIENPIFNLEGLIKRFGLLTGEGGTRSIAYSSGVDGFFALLIDTLLSMINNHFGLPFFILSIAGFIVLIYINRSDFKKIIIYSIFFTASLSYYIFFVQIIKQSLDRFQFPMAIFLSAYGGYAIYYFYKIVHKKYKWILNIILISICIYSFYNTITINVNLLFDVRYKAEKWIKMNIPEGSKIERYSDFTYLPRIPESMNDYRITIEDDVLNIEERKPDYLILTSKYYPRFLHDVDQKEIDGRLNVTDKKLKTSLSDFNRFFKLLFDNKLNYILLIRFDYDMKYFKHYNVTPDHIIIYKRNVKK